MKRLVILGGGASGVLLAVHTLRNEETNVRIALVEKRLELGAGAAYATNHPDHLLNVRASNMSAFPDDPDHFVRWLARHPAAAHEGHYQAGCFAPRRFYRDYLAGLLAPHFRSGRLVRVHAEAVRIRESATELEVHLAGGGWLAGDVVVVATGNEGPGFEPAPWRHDGWSDTVACSIPPEAPVLVIGTGLTMVDRVLGLLQAGHRGPITAVSRRGLIPHPHKMVPLYHLAADEIPFGTPLWRRVRWIRMCARERAGSGADWRSLIDALRPHTPALWRDLSLEDRRRFLRHARPFWDIHRHRIAPEAARALWTACDRGQFRSLSARVIGFEPCGSGVEVHLAHRTTGRPEVVYAEAVFECRGRSSDITRSENPVLRDLLASGMARPDALGLGLDVTAECAIVHKDGRISQRLYGIGPITSGTFWESVAVPDIRVQAAKLGALLG